MISISEIRYIKEVRLSKWNMSGCGIHNNFSSTC